jgi:hypothetical protein
MDGPLLDQQPVIDAPQQQLDESQYLQQEAVQLSVNGEYQQEQQPGEVLQQQPPIAFEQQPAAAAEQQAGVVLEQQAAAAVQEHAAIAVEQLAAVAVEQQAAVAVEQQPAEGKRRRHKWGPPAAGEFAEEGEKKPKKRRSRWESSTDLIVPTAKTGAIVIPGQLPREVTICGGIKVSYCQG